MSDFMIITDASFGKNSDGNDTPDASDKLSFIEIEVFASANSDEPIKTADPAYFYTKQKCGALPVTRPIDSKRFKEAFTEILEAGRDILYIGISKGISDTVCEAEKAAGELRNLYPDRRVIVADSKAAGKTEELLLKEALSAAESGMDIDSVAVLLDDKKSKFNQLLMADGFYHLKRGGKLVAQDTIDSKALKIKPIIGIDEEGRLSVISRQRGLGNAYSYLAAKVKEYSESEDEVAFSDRIIYISHAGAPERAEKVKSLLEEEGFKNEIVIESLSPVYGTHTGPGAVCITL